MDSWRTHKYNCHLSPSLQRLRHTGTERRSAWRAVEPCWSCAGDRSVCKTDHINTSFLSQKIGPTGGSGKLHPKDRRKMGRGRQYLYITSKVNLLFSNTHTRTEAGLTGNNMYACQLKQSCINKNSKIASKKYNIKVKQGSAWILICTLQLWWKRQVEQTADWTTAQALFHRLGPF